LDHADIATVGGHIKVDVTSIAPASAPRVADNPVGFRARRRISDSLNAVVDRAGAGLEDTAGVGLPRLSSNANGDRASGVQHRLELTTGRGHIAGVGGDGFIGFASGAELAATSLSNVVRIIGISIKTIALLDGVGVSIMRPASIATVVVVSTSSALLNRLNNQSAVLDHVERLLSLIGRVSPAGAALALVLDRGDIVLASMVAPVNITGHHVVGEGGKIWGTVGEILHQANRELLLSHVSEDVHTKDFTTTNGNMVSILLGNALKSRLEDPESVLSLL